MKVDHHWTVTQGGPDPVMNAILAELATLGWKNLDRQGLSAQARAGSRLALRFYGIYLKAGRERFPMRLVFSVSESPEGSTVNASLISDEGWYAFMAPAVKKFFDEAAAELFEALEGATRSKSSQISE